VAAIQDEVLSAKPLAYSRVLALDDKLRSYELPLLLQYKAPIPAEYAADAAMITFKRALYAILIHCRASPVSCDLAVLIVWTVTLQLHHSYWTIATREYAADPLGSPYGPSVTIAFRSASALLAIADTTYEYMVTKNARYPAAPFSSPRRSFQQPE
jgi:hypothetical protein